MSVATYSTPKAHAVNTQNAQIQRPWTDTLSGGLWARLNNFERNSSVLDSAQAQAILGSLAPSGSSSQLPQTMFTNNFRVTTNSSLFPLEDEPSIAVRNQTGQFLMVVGANSLSTGLMASYVSADQGTHWEGPVYLPLSKSSDTFASDPALAVDHSGTFYYAFLSIGFSFFFPSGGQDDVVVATSADGVHWMNHVAVQRRASFSNSTIRSELFDKDYIAVGPNKSNPSVDAVYVTYTDFVDYCSFGLSFACGENSTIMQVHSVDGGVTWSKPMAVSPSVTTTSSSFQTSSGRLVQGSMPAVAQNGDVYVAYYDSGKYGWLNASASIMVTKSTNGGATFSAPTQAAFIPQQLTFASEGSFCCFRWWSSMFPSMDVASDGTVYIAYGARQSKFSLDPADVFLVASTDGGATWSPPNKINDDSTQRAQFFPWLKVSSDRVVHIIWGDMRLDPVGLGYDIFYAEATNHGTTISTNSRVTDVGTDPLFTIGFVGDYFNMAVSGNQVYPVWTDGRRGLSTIGREFLFGETDIFTARLGPRDTPNIALGHSVPAGYVAPVPVSGSGLPRDAFFLLKMSGVQLLSQTSGISFFFSDDAGDLSNIMIPSSNYYGAYTVELDEWVSGAQLASTTLYVVNTQNLQVLVTGPSTAFPGDSVTWNLQVVSPIGTLNQQGFSSTISITKALLTSPSGSVQDLTGNIKPVGPSSYSLSTTLSNNSAPGSYSVFVSASQTGLVVQSSGSTSATIVLYNRATSITVSCNPALVQVGQAATCSALVTDIALGSARTPTGTVTWTSSGPGSFSSATCALSGSGVSATCSVNYNAHSAGSQVITGSYGGNTAQPGATQQTTLVVVVPANGPSNSSLVVGALTSGAGVIGLVAGAAVGVLAIRRKTKSSVS
jgi:hypothetical protein